MACQLHWNVFVDFGDSSCILFCWGTCLGPSTTCTSPLVALRPGCCGLSKAFVFFSAGLLPFQSEWTLASNLFICCILQNLNSGSEVSLHSPWPEAWKLHFHYEGGVGRSITFATIGNLELLSYHCVPVET
jgi:hypothetical protein